MYREINGNARTSPKFQRTGSQICPSPDVELLEAVFKNDVDKIRRIILHNRHLLVHIYTPEHNKTILQIACSEDGVEARTVKTLLDLGANPRDYDENGWEALHLAVAHKTDSETLRVLLDRNPGDINVTAKGSNALHILVRYGNSDSEEFTKCAEILIKKGINVNLGDSNNVSPILWAAKKGFRSMVQTILDKSDIPVDLDYYRLRGKSARDLITAQDLYNGVLPPPVENQNLDERQILFSYLKTGNEDGFVNFRNGNIEHLVDCDESTSTLLQMCCEKGLTRAARHLLDQGADSTKTTGKNTSTPVELAAENGNHEIFEMLIKKDSNIPSQVLSTLLKYIDREHVGNQQCFEVLMKALRKKAETQPDEVLLILNEEDKMKNTPLHYAIRYADRKIIYELLSLGASLGARNKAGLMPVEDIEPEVLESHLDSCIEFDMKNKKIGKEDFVVTFNYRTLIPPYVRHNTSATWNDLEAAKLKNSFEKKFVAETEVIYYMSCAAEFKHLLKHPVITSFLLMKWRRIQWLFWTNLIFYIIFSLSLVTYIFTSYIHFSPETTSLQTILGNVAYGLLGVSLVVLALRELFQIFVSPINYLKNFENYIEIVLVALTGMIILIRSPTVETTKQLSSLTILLAAFELVLMLGQHPYFSTNVVMLRTVSFNFFKFLVWYSLLIIAFALSFYILFATGDAAGQKVNETASEDDNLFDNPGKSVFKTVIMLTGEFDASSINFQMFPIVSKLIFALFIFMIAIILLNLLNGLAVSDTQTIKNDAELVGHIARAHHVRYVETMWLGNVIPANFFRRLSDFCCCVPTSGQWNVRVFDILAKNGFLFPNYLNYELLVYPNRWGLVSLPDKPHRCQIGGCASCSDVYLDRETVKRTNQIVHSRRDEKIKKEDILPKEIMDALAYCRNTLDMLVRQSSRDGSNS